MIFICHMPTQHVMQHVMQHINPWYQRYVHVCCTALVRPNQAETVLSAVAYSLVPHDDQCHAISYGKSSVLLFITSCIYASIQ